MRCVSSATHEVIPVHIVHFTAGVDFQSVRGYDSRAIQKLRAQLNSDKIYTRYQSHAIL